MLMIETTQQLISPCNAQEVNNEITEEDKNAAIELFNKFGIGGEVNCTHPRISCDEENNIKKMFETSKLTFSPAQLTLFAVFCLFGDWFLVWAHLMDIFGVAQNIIGHQNRKFSAFVAV